MNSSSIVHLADGLIIRPIQSRDNEELVQLISNVWTEYSSSSYFEDTTELRKKRLDQLYAVPAGQPMDRGYWVVFDEKRERVLGGCGFAPLVGSNPNDTTCEMQKLYFHPDLRGRGFGRQLVSWVIEQATHAGYTEIYLETNSKMVNAIRLYERFGFQREDVRKGTTGHWDCDVFMSRPLTSAPAPAISQTKPQLALVR